MPFDPVLAAIRFGTGLSPVIPPPASAAAMMDRLLGPDETAARLPITPYAQATPTIAEYNETSRNTRRGSSADQLRSRQARADLRLVADANRYRDALTGLTRAVTAEDALRERLVLFWADHFTVLPKSLVWHHLIQPFIEEAIRPRVAGSFADLLVAVETHPAMLTYLDQARSIGPGSRAGRNGTRGLNENLARELLELHTLGVGGPYAQGDVRQLAELLTGLGVGDDGALQFNPGRSEPGAETVLGVTYADEASLANVEAALRDIALHPATAAHIGRKLAVHFVADDPDPDLAAALTDAFASTGGDLAAVTATLLDHPASWSPEKRKVKPPVEFVASSLRALGVGERVLMAFDRRETTRTLLNPLGVMGQPWLEPGGPDGWPETAEAWVQPQFQAARIDWAMNRPEELATLPDPRLFVETALGPTASEAVVFAARAAERPGEGVGCVLASPDFQRR